MPPPSQPSRDKSQRLARRTLPPRRSRLPHSSPYALRKPVPQSSKPEAQLRVRVAHRPPPPVPTLRARAHALSL